MRVTEPNIDAAKMPAEGIVVRLSWRATAAHNGLISPNGLRMQFGPCSTTGCCQ